MKRLLLRLGNSIVGGIVLALFALMRRLGPRARAGPLRCRRPHDRSAAAGASRRPRQYPRRLPRKGCRLASGHPETGVGQSGPGRRRIRASRQALGFRSRAPAPGSHPVRRCSLFIESADRRQTGFVLLGASGELGTRRTGAAPAYGMESAVVYRMPNNPIVAREIQRIRAASMGQLIRTRNQAPIEMAGALTAGKHVGMLTDQHFSRGVDITFFGRRCKANPAIARLARHFDCPVVGMRVIRRADGGFSIQGVGPLTLPHDASGKMDVTAATQMINADRGRVGARISGTVALVPPALALNTKRYPGVR